VYIFLSLKKLNTLFILNLVAFHLVNKGFGSIVYYFLYSSGVITLISFQSTTLLLHPQEEIVATRTYLTTLHSQQTSTWFTSLLPATSESSGVCPASHTNTEYYCHRIARNTTSRHFLLLVSIINPPKAGSSTKLTQ
jgi:hypothetical protein